MQAQLNKSLLPRGHNAVKTVLRQQGQFRVGVLFLVLVCMGISIGATWYYRDLKEIRGQENSGRPAGDLSECTRDVLGRLQLPVEIRFYSLLDPTGAPAAERNYAARVNQLLARYESEAGGKITVSRIDTSSDANMSAASADGIKPFNLGIGDACYLGFAVVCDGRREVIPRIFAEWEQALEFDLSRAIARVIQADSTATVSAELGRLDAGVVEEVKRLVPNVESVSVEEGTRILREAALNEFTAAVSEMEQQVKAAQARLAQAQNGKPEAEQRAAMDELRKVQAAQTEKIRLVTARLQDQIAALEKIKKN